LPYGCNLGAAVVVVDVPSRACQGRQDSERSQGFPITPPSSRRHINDLEAGRAGATWQSFGAGCVLVVWSCRSHGSNVSERDETGRRVWRRPLKMPVNAYIAVSSWTPFGEARGRCTRGTNLFLSGPLRPMLPSRLSRPWLAHAFRGPLYEPLLILRLCSLHFLVLYILCRASRTRTSCLHGLSRSASYSCSRETCTSRALTS